MTAINPKLRALTPWNLHQLKSALTRDLRLCQTEHEKALCRAICGKEIRETAERLAATRKLTPGEIAIAQEFGFREPSAVVLRG